MNNTMAMPAAVQLIVDIEDISLLKTQTGRHYQAVCVSARQSKTHLNF